MEIKNRKISSYICQNELKIEDIVKDFSNYVYTIIRKSYINLSSEDIDEIVLDVFLAVWKNTSKLDINRDMSAYISGITKNLIKKKCRNLNLNENIEDYEEELIEDNDIELDFIESEKTQIIVDEAKKLKGEDKEIFIKYYYEEKSIREISECCNITQSKVKIKLYRIRKKIKKVLKEKGYDFDEK